LFSFGPSGALVALVALGAIGLLLARLAIKAIGGQTGDVLGALEQVGEAAVLLIAASLL
jgi:adenosylcobinamide-GDP ribazoletransferase